MGPLRRVEVQVQSRRSDSSREVWPEEPLVTTGLSKQNATKGRGQGVQEEGDRICPGQNILHSCWPETGGYQGPLTSCAIPWPQDPRGPASFTGFLEQDTAQGPQAAHRARGRGRSEEPGTVTSPSPLAIQVWPHTQLKRTTQEPHTHAAVPTGLQDTSSGFNPTSGFPSFPFFIIHPLAALSFTGNHIPEGVI